jgi:hypothetical protein
MNRATLPPRKRRPVNPVPLVLALSAAVLKSCDKQDAPQAVRPFCGALHFYCLPASSLQPTELGCLWPPSLEPRAFGSLFYTYFYGYTIFLTFPNFSNTLPTIEPIIDAPCKLNPPAPHILPQAGSSSSESGPQVSSRGTLLK